MCNWPINHRKLGPEVTTSDQILYRREVVMGVAVAVAVVEVAALAVSYMYNLIYKLILQVAIAVIRGMSSN